MLEEQEGQWSGGYLPQTAVYLPTSVDQAGSTAKSCPHFDTWLLSTHDWAHHIFFRYACWSLACTTHPIWSPPVSPLQGGLHPIWLTAGTGSQKPKSCIWHILQATGHPVVHGRFPLTSHYLLLGAALKNLFVVSPSSPFSSAGPTHLNPPVSSQTMWNSKILLLLSGLLPCQEISTAHLCSQIARSSFISSHQLAI